jgi:hypothetical protein
MRICKLLSSVAIVLLMLFAAGCGDNKTAPVASLDNPPIVDPDPAPVVDPDDPPVVDPDDPKNWQSLEPKLISTTSVATEYVATDGQWLAWTAKDRQGIYLADPAADINLTADLPPQFYPEEFVFDGRFVAFVVDNNKLFYIDTADDEPSASMIASSDDRINYFDLDNGELVWIDNDDATVYYLNLKLADKTPQAITSDDASKIMIKVNDGVIVWSVSQGNWRIQYYDVKAAIPGVIQPAGQTNYDHWQASVHDRLIVWQGSDAGADVEIFYCDLRNGGTTAIKLTDNLTDDRHPQVHNGLIAWDAIIGGQEAIFFIDTKAASPTIQSLPTALSNDRLSHVRDGIIAWTAYKDNWSQVLYYDTKAALPAIVELTDSSAFHSYAPQIADGKIFWHAFDLQAGNGVIASFDILQSMTSDFRVLPNSDIMPVQAGNDQVVWLSTGRNPRIFARRADLPGAPVAVTPASMDVRSIDIDNGVVAFMTRQGSQDPLYVIDLNAQDPAPVMISNDAQSGERPRISKNIVVWIKQVSPGVHQVFYADLSASVLEEKMLQTPFSDVHDLNTDGDYISWLSGTWPNFEVFYADLSAPTVSAIQLTNNSVWEAGPIVDQGIVAWYRQNSGNINDIWYVDLNAEPLQERQITSSSTFDDRVTAVNNGIIVWIRNDNAVPGQNIYYADTNSPSATAVQVTDDNTHKGNPGINNGQMIWSQGGDIYVYDIFAAQPQIICVTDSRNNSSPSIKDGALIWRVNHGCARGTFAAIW